MIAAQSQACFDLAQSYYMKMPAQPGDPALVRKAVETYQKLQELEADNPRLPAEYRQWLKQLYDTIIASLPDGS